MAAHDEKISSNRRKLFKALSAAPVVYTLDSGATGANASAFQCARKHREHSNHYHWKDRSHDHDFEHVGNDMYRDRTDGSLYRKHNYWMTDESRFDVECTNGVSCPTIVVEDHDGTLLDMDGNPAMNVRKSGTFRNGNPVLVATKLDWRGNEKDCFKVEGHKGYAAYIGHTEDHDRRWVEKGFSPKHKMGGGGMGEKQKLPPSCMNSIMNSGSKLVQS